MELLALFARTKMNLGIRLASKEELKSTAFQDLGVGTVHAV